MDNQSLSNVLNILRLIQRAKPSQSSFELIKVWAGEGLSEASILKVAAYLSEQATEAVTVIDNSDLPDEIRAGLRETLVGVQKAFALGGIQSSPAAYVKHVTGSISTLGMLLTMSGLPSAEQEPPPEVSDLAAEVEELIRQFDNGDIDPVVRQLAREHLQTLATLLRHVNVFGLEAALATYFELLTRLRRAEASSTAKSKAETKPMHERIKGWAENFKSLDSICNSAGRMLGRAKTVAGLITYFSSSASS